MAAAAADGLRPEPVSVLELRRNLSGLLETTQRRPLMVHRYGAPWVCILSDAQWTQMADLLQFDPQGHPLAALRGLHQQFLMSTEADATAPGQRLLILQAIYRLPDVGAWVEQLRYNRLLAWFAAPLEGRGRALDAAQLRAQLLPLLDQPDALTALLQFLQYESVMALRLACGGDAAPLSQADVMQMAVR